MRLFDDGRHFKSPSSVAPMFLAVGLHMFCPHETEWRLDPSRNSFDESMISELCFTSVDVHWYINTGKVY